MDSSRVLDIFKDITRIPRESGHEEPITAFLMDWASAHGLEARKDNTGNVCIVKKASEGKESVPTLVLQAHQDMVCEKNAGVEHDFRKDPIRFEIRDGWMIAPETTLGADDGIGIAACLALLESDLPTGKLECVFTISEETGMDGAFAMEEGFFTGKTLINLDSEDEGQLFIGCAGGLNTSISFKHGWEPVKNGFQVVEIGIEKATGGHSGDDINKNRTNAVQQMAVFLKEEFKGDIQLLEIRGGGKTNAIARECHAVVALPDAKSLVERFYAFGAALKKEHKDTDPEMVFVSTVPGESRENAVDTATAKKVIEGMVSCVHGVISMSKDIEGLVQTSNNLASIKMQDDDTILILTGQRSSDIGEREMAAKMVKDNFAPLGAEVVHFNRYPGWQPNVNSPVLDLCRDSYRRIFNEEPLVLAIHAGLECGLFLDKFPGLDMISFGPTLRSVHAPGERMELASLDRFVKHLQDVVCSFK